ncbi:methyl-accepting chemotaxis protein [Halorientalis brevis]|uniref:Methyl-accepting chemotaxis protein n=1 Tax=Halorientalis brevis TaxID=1126241 RepID=A0ABD6CDB3_9EURY|nr:methyl-accepting chemotaxis protein [Halorientalis brevis]
MISSLLRRFTGTNEREIDSERTGQTDPVRAADEESPASAVASDGGAVVSADEAAPSPSLDHDEDYYQEIDAPTEFTTGEVEGTVRANLEQVLNASGTAMRIIGPEFNVIMQNDMMDELSGVDDDRLEEVPCYGAMCNDDVCGTDNCTLKRLMAGETDRIEVEVEKDTYDGRTVPTKLVATAIKNDAGDVVAISESFIDLSDMKSVTEQFNDVVDDVSSGSLDTEVDTTDLEWYYEDMGESLNEMIAVVDEAMEQLDQITDDLRDARLDTDRDVDSLPGIFGKIVDDLDQTAEHMIEEMQRRRSVADGVQTSVNDLLDSSEEVSSDSQEITALVEEQHASMQDISAEVSNLSATVEEIASSAEEVNASSEQAERLAEEGRDSAEDAIDVMENIDSAAADVTSDVNRLREAVAEIDDIVDVINDIAEQTNILALNASIEAARAGEAGEGFAVVANEVKSLAEESQQHASEIESVVSTISEDTEETVASLQDANEQVDMGREMVEESMGNLEDIVTAVRETSNGIDEVAAATDEQAHSTEQVAGMVDDAVRKADSISDRAIEVADLNEKQVEQVHSIETDVERLREQ